MALCLLLLFVKESIFVVIIDDNGVVDCLIAKSIFSSKFFLEYDLSKVCFFLPF